MTSAQTVTRSPSLNLARRLSARPETVFEAWTNAEHLKAWFCPGPEFSVELAEADARVGGGYRVVMIGPDGEKHDVSGTYLEVVPHERLVFDWAWASTPERVSRVTLELRPDGAGTELTLTHTQFADEEARDDHEEGWRGALDRLVRHFG